METTEHELDISTHDLARRSTVPHDPETGLLIISTHDLTRRSTKSNASTILNGVNFNSRSHKEVDFHARRCVLCRICISTHDLTKRSTHHLSNTDHIDRVSTHDLSKRSTGPALTPCQWQKSFNSRPHEEVDTLRTPSALSATVCFNSRPHEEVDSVPRKGFFGF